jgi:hypothetical protein
MTFYIRNVNSFRVSDSNPNQQVVDHLPVGTYIIEQDMHGNFYLNLIDDFTNPKRIYGDTIRNSDRILRTFRDRPSATGVMLTGEKGSGKSLLARTISIQAREQGISTIVINRPWCGDGFNKLMQDIQQPVVVLFDEFEKVYGESEQEAILTLFDGMFPTQKLFVLTTNDKWRVDRHMRNRPGRIYYMLEFSGVSQEFIEEYCRENLLNQDHVESVMRVASLFDRFNFDMLKAMVEEMNRYGETAQEAMSILNTRPEYSERVTYDVSATVAGVPIDTEHLDDATMRGNPVIDEWRFGYHDVRVRDEDGDPQWTTARINPSMLRSVDSKSGRMVFQAGELTLTLTRPKPQTYDYKNWDF